MIIWTIQKGLPFRSSFCKRRFLVRSTLQRLLSAGVYRHPLIKGQEVLMTLIVISSRPVLLNTPKISWALPRKEGRSDGESAEHPTRRRIWNARCPSHVRKPTRPRVLARAGGPPPERTMTRRCSHCSNNGHNSRTCPARSGGGGVRLFGVRLTTAPAPAAMKKSASMSCIASSLGGGFGGSSPPAGGDGGCRGGGDGGAGYVSDDPAHASCSTNGRAERKKGEVFFSNTNRFLKCVMRFSRSASCPSNAFLLDELAPWATVMKLQKLLICPLIALYFIQLYKYLFPYFAFLVYPYYILFCVKAYKRTKIQFA